MQWQRVLDFWFTESSPRQWFTKDKSFDERVRSEFAEVHAMVARGETAEWRSKPAGRLAEVIVLDQFSRNMFRGSKEAFAYDERALALAEEAIRVGADKALSRTERRFLYMPYMHSESKEVHRRAVWLFLSLFDWRTFSYELLHKRIIDSFGRYPHRNEILGRASTAEEKEFVKTHKGF